MRRTPEEMAIVKPRKIEWWRIEREVEELPKGSEVFLCFTCDPYQPIETELKIMRRVIEMLHANNVGVRILTKAGSLPQRDFGLLEAHPELSAYGATLTFSTSMLSAGWEPGAALPSDRIRSLEEAHKRGISTWASLEPVIVPAETIELIHMSAPFVDLFKVGRWNHDIAAEAIDWKAFVKEAVDTLRSLGKPYYIKQETRRYLPSGYPPEWDGRYELYSVFCEITYNTQGPRIRLLSI
jgi:DNA repair photolyase